jgi:hypothetical protein
MSCDDDEVGDGVLGVSFGLLIYWRNTGNVCVRRWASGALNVVAVYFLGKKMGVWVSSDGVMCELWIRT